MRADLLEQTNVSAGADREPASAPYGGAGSEQVGLGVIEKMTLIVDAFKDGPERLLLEDLTDLTGLPRSTVFRLLRQLVDLGWIEHGGRGYRLGPRLASAGGDRPSNERIRTAASNPLAELHLTTGAVCHLSVLDSGMTYFLDKVGGQAFGTVPSRVGARLRVTDSVSGLAMLSMMSPEDAETTALLNGHLSDHDLLSLHQTLHQVRQRGVAILPGACRISKITSIGIAIPSPGGPIAALSLAYKGNHPVERFVPRLRIAVQQTARQLYGLNDSR